MKLYLATENGGKVREISEHCKGRLQEISVHSLTEYPGFTRAAYKADETGTTYAANALIKARALLRTKSNAKSDTDMRCYILAEDSGFAVEALRGEPGVYSARYAASDAERCAKIIQALAGKPRAERRAQFVACMALLDAEGNPTYFFGRKNGYVAEQPRGNQGFGYDPIFCPEAEGPTWGEMTTAQKNADSHRTRALGLVIRYLASPAPGL